jgi:hypothetical protein
MNNSSNNWPLQMSSREFDSLITQIQSPLYVTCVNKLVDALRTVVNADTSGLAADALRAYCAMGEVVAHPGDICPTGLPKLRADGIPRRADVTLDTPLERIIRNAVYDVEQAGAHPLLTDAVVLLQQAKDKVSDFVELPPHESRDV